MTPEDRLEAATQAVDAARRARALATTDADREATWRDLVEAIRTYNIRLREVSADLAGFGAPA